MFGWSQPTFLRVLQYLIFLLPPLIALFTYVLLRGRARRWATTVR